jgi:hypothetical protein
MIDDLKKDITVDPIVNNINDNDIENIKTIDHIQTNPTTNQSIHKRSNKKLIILSIIILLIIVAIFTFFIYRSNNKKVTDKKSITKTNSLINNISTKKANNIRIDSWTGQGANDNWNNPGNWNNGIPKNGDNIVLNMSKEVALKIGTLNSNDNMPKLTINNITFSGGSDTGVESITLSGEPIILTGGITNLVQKATDVIINNKIYLDNNQSFKNGGGVDYFGGLNISRYNLSLYGSSTFNLTSGTGYITVEPTANLYFNYGITNSSLNNTIEVMPNGILSEGSANGFGNATLDINNGGALEFVAPNNGKEIINNSIILSGSGVSNSINTNQGAIFTIPSPSIPTTIIFNGVITLEGNTELGNYIGNASAPVTYDFTTSIQYNGYTLKPIPNNNVTITDV